MPALLFEGLTGASVTLSCLYFGVAILTTKQLIWLHKNSSTGLNTRKLFVMTCLLTAVLRVMSFASMAILDFAKKDFHIDPSDKLDTNDDDSDGKNQDFFNCAFLVLFDFPDFCCISAYMLLILVWAESYLKSRRHWLSNFTFRKMWMLVYFVFNTVLYTAQVTLYSLLFFPFVDNAIELTLIYITLACFNIGLPLCWSAAYLYLAIQFSGFPFSSEDAKMRLRTLSRLGLIWTSARLGWGIIALTTVVEGWLVEAQKSTLFYTVVLIAIFLFVEIIPICVSVRSGVLDHFSDKDVCHHHNAHHGRYQTLPQDPNSVILDTQHNVLLPAAARHSDKKTILVNEVDPAGRNSAGSASGNSASSNTLHTLQNTIHNTMHNSAHAGNSPNNTRSGTPSNTGTSVGGAIIPNVPSNSYLNRANTFTRTNTNLSRKDTFSPMANQDASHEDNHEYWEGGIYGRGSHHTGSYNSSSYTGSYETARERRANARTWGEWLGLS